MNYNPNQQFNYNPKQLRLPLDIEIKISYDSEVRTFLEVFNESEVKKYLKPSSTKGRKGYNNVEMLKLVLFCFMEGKTTLREISKAAKTDIRVMWLINEIEPSHNAIKEFINKELKESISDIFDCLNKYLIIKDKIDYEKLYVDGTKIESRANKYTFVWKNSVLKNRDKLYKKVSKELIQMSSYFEMEGIYFEVKETYTIADIEKYYKFISKEVDKLGISFVYGKGQKKSDIQRFYDNMSEYLSFLTKYETDLDIMGENRNSYSKTDHDATFMHMKEDHMRNSQLKPGYNIQIGVSEEYIMHLDIFQDRNDYETFIPFMEGYYQRYEKYPKYTVADSGYGCFYNFKYLKENNLGLYLKYTYYQKDKYDKKWINNPYRYKNFKQDDAGNYICPNDKKLTLEKVITTNDHGFDRTYHHYQCKECFGCPYRTSCTKSKYGRTIQINHEANELETEAFINLNTELGHELKIQRSIQVEGAFGVIKECFRYRRFRRKGIENVKLEFYLISIGYNLSKYHNKKYRINH